MQLCPVSLIQASNEMPGTRLKSNPRSKDNSSTVSGGVASAHKDGHSNALGRTAITNSISRQCIQSSIHHYRRQIRIYLVYTLSTQPSQLERGTSNHHMHHRKSKDTPEHASQAPGNAALHPSHNITKYTGSPLGYRPISARSLLFSTSLANSAFSRLFSSNRCLAEKRSVKRASRSAFNLISSSCNLTCHLRSGL